MDRLYHSVQKYFVLISKHLDDKSSGLVFWYRACYSFCRRAQYMFEVTTLNRLPIPIRHKKRALESIPEWSHMQQKLREGLRPYEAAVVKFTPDQVREFKVKTVGKVFLTMARELVTDLKIRADVWKYTAEDGSLVVVVADRGIVGEPLPVPVPPVKRSPGRPKKAA
jgi:hypothetical protein